MSSRSPLTHSAILGIFCLGFGLMLALTELVTSDPIRQRAEEDKQNSLAQVIPPGLHDNNPLNDAVTVPGAGEKAVTVFRALRNHRVTAVAYEIHGSGYGGEIKLMLGVDAEGKILGVRALLHKETPGLGDKIEPAKSDWITRFTGLSLGSPPVERWKVRKDGGDFDQFSGATITPRGVVTAIRGGLEFFAAHKAQLLEAH